MGLGSRIRDLGFGKNLFRIPHPGVKKAPDPGSGSATLAYTVSSGAVGRRGKAVLRSRNYFFRFRLHGAANPNCGSGSCSDSSPGSE
jgi:hypothetical protein